MSILHNMSLCQSDYMLRINIYMERSVHKLAHQSVRR